MPSPADRCLLCTMPARRSAEGVRGYQAGRTYTVHACDSCGASFVTPHTVDDALYGRIYENIRFVPGYNRYLRYAEEVGRRRDPLRYLGGEEESYWAVARYLRTIGRPPSSLKVLEVGCGMGYFTYALARAGYDALGVDLSTTAIEWATAHFGPNFSTQALQDLAAAGRRFDVVVMNQLIEHIPDIAPFLAEALGVLARDGAILITTPNKTSYPGGIWRTELPPVHLWWLGEDAIRHLAGRHGCEVSFVDFTAFYRVNRRAKTADAEAQDRPQVFDEMGRLLVSDLAAAASPWKRLLDRAGLGSLLRAARALLPGGGERWHGPRGEVMAAVLRRAPNGA